MMAASNQGQDWVGASYSDRYYWLRRIKAKYDPGNLFRKNQNISPA